MVKSDPERFVYHSDRPPTPRLLQCDVTGGAHIFCERSPECRNGLRRYYKSSWEKFPDGTDHIIVRLMGASAPAARLAMGRLAVSD
jgi:hypothetical protein